MKKRNWRITIEGGETIVFEAEQCSTAEGVLFLSNEVSKERFDKMVARAKMSQGMSQSEADLIEPPQEPSAIFPPGAWLRIQEVE